MHTEKDYYYYRSSESVTSEILEVRDLEKQGQKALILDHTIFYPEGGGQSADRGTINGISLVDVQEKDGEILHFVNAKDSAALKPGSAELTLDAVRRRDYTTLHTAQHLLSGTILRMTGKYTVSMHLGEDLCTIDVDGGIDELNAEKLTAVENVVMDAIEENCPVHIHLCPPEDIASFPLRKTPPAGEDIIRVVEIVGKDVSPCCGTHCASTGEIGMLRILGAEKYKGMTRISFIAGRRCLNDSRLLRQNAEKVSRALKVPVYETAESVLSLLEKNVKLEGKINVLENEAAEKLARALLEKYSGNGFIHVEGLLITETFNSTMEEVLRTGRAAQKQIGNDGNALLVLASEPELKFAVFCTDKGRDLRKEFKETMEANNGRGGGGNGFFQGLFPDKSSLDSFMKTVSKGR